MSLVIAQNVMCNVNSKIMQTNCAVYCISVDQKYVKHVKRTVYKIKNIIILMKSKKSVYNLRYFTYLKIIIIINY